VLLAEDVDSNRTIINEFLKNRNLRMVFALDGEEAVRLAKEEKPDIILMDIQMPVMDGIEAAKIIKDFYSPEKIPIIALTAALVGNDKDIISIFDSVISKPVARIELLSEMNRFLPSTFGNVVLENQENRVPLFVNELNDEQYHILEKLLKDDLYKKYQNIRHTILIDEVIEFAENVIGAGRDFEIDFLEQYGNSIKLYAETFRIELLRKAIESFDDTINTILSKGNRN
jgi:CheY-like chemotaxis protein